ncbi:flagellar M-ring protein FliF [bacterium]|nr:flagellar M-ring protein FliF [bacterium]
MLDFLNRFPPPVRIGIMAGVPVLLIVITLFIGMAIGGGGKKQPTEEQLNKNDVVLYRRMSQLSAGEAAAKLQEERIPFKLVEDGTAISVPKDKSDKARVSLAAAGLPKDGDPGFSLFDKSDFISTDFDKKIKLLRAMNGEIKRLVKQVDGVEDAAAMVTMPEDSLFQTEKKPVTAAVMVKMQPKRSLTPSQVEGLTHLIASSVPGLLTDNVTITDDLGNLLTSGMEANAGNKEDRMVSRVLNMQMSLQRQKEQEIEQKLTTLLDKVVGSGKAVVRVSLELDFNKRLVRNTLKAAVTNGNGETVPLTKSEQTETVQGGGDGGAPGTVANVPTYPAIPSTPGGSKEVTKKNLKEQPAFNEETQLVQPSSGNIKRMSIAVLIPDTLKQESADRLRIIIATAAGADPARRDQVNVERVRFDASTYDDLKKQLTEEETAEKTAKKGQSVSWAIVWWIGGALLLIFLLLALLRRATRKEANPLDTLTASLGGEAEALPMFDQQALGGFDPNAFPGLDMGQGGFMQPGMDQFGGQFDQQGGYADAGYDQQGYADMGAQAQAPQGGGAFDFMYEVSPDAAAAAFDGERPATIAGVLATLDPSYAEQVLQYLDPSIQEDVFNRVNQGATLPSMTARMASQNLKRKLGANVG